MLEDRRGFLFGEGKADVSQAPVELRLLNLTVAIVVKLLEHP